MGSVSMSDCFLSHHLEQRLVSASGCGDVSTVRKLLRKNVSKNVMNEYGKTALYVASQGGYSDIVRLLLDAGADVNKKNGAQATALHAAATNERSETVKHLVLGGAALDATTLNGITPVDLTPYHSDTRDILSDAARGDMPEIEDESEVPEIPDHALPDGASGKKKKKKSGKKGKKGKGKKGGKKGGKKKGGKKKGKKKKK